MYAVWSGQPAPEAHRVDAENARRPSRPRPRGSPVPSSSRGEVGCARRVVMRHAGRVLRAGLQEDGGDGLGAGRPRARPRLRPSSSTGDADHLGPDRLQEVDQRREARGLDHDAVAEAQRACARSGPCASMAPSTTVSSSAAYGQSGPAASRAGRAGPGRRGSCRVCRPWSASPGRWPGWAAGRRRGRRWTGRGRSRSGARGPAGSARRRSVLVAARSCRAGRRCGRCRSGPAAPRRR